MIAYGTFIACFTSALSGIGPRTLEKIKEILSTGKLERTARLLGDPKIQTLMLFHKAC
jgi:DNA polymerase/3'-5' exonuclease PolX